MEEAATVREGPGDEAGAVSSRQRTWPLVLVGVVVAAAGLAAGARISPSDAIDALRGAFEDEPEIDLVAADVVAVDESGATRIEVWFGPSTADGDECRFVRVVSVTSGIVDGAVRCVDEPMLPWSEPEFEVRTTSQYFGFVHETPIGMSETGFDAVAISGAVHPAVTAVTARFGDGAEYSFVPDPELGWFAVVLPSAIADPSVEDGRLVNVLVELELFDAEGRVLTTVDVPAWRLATGLR